MPARSIVSNRNQMRQAREVLKALPPKQREELRYQGIGPGDSYIGMWRMVNAYRFKLNALCKAQARDNVYPGGMSSSSLCRSEGRGAGQLIFGTRLGRHARARAAVLLVPGVGPMPRILGLHALPPCGEGRGVESVMVVAAAKHVALNMLLAIPSMEPPNAPEIHHPRPKPDELLAARRRARFALLCRRHGPEERLSTRLRGHARGGPLRREQRAAYTRRSGAGRRSASVSRSSETSKS
jgi:hypothetical protein